MALVDFRPPALYIGRASRYRAALSTLALFGLLVASVAGAEQERVDGMGRTRGWVVADDGGGLSFVDCQGGRSELGSSRIEDTSGRCPTPSTSHQLTAIVRSVDRARRIVHAEDESGRLRAFHVPADVPRLEELTPGERIHASGPIEGQITGFTRH